MECQGWKPLGGRRSHRLFWRADIFAILPSSRSNRRPSHGLRNASLNFTKYFVYYISIARPIMHYSTHGVELSTKPMRRAFLSGQRCRSFSLGPYWRMRTALDEALVIPDLSRLWTPLAESVRGPESSRQQHYGVFAFAICIDLQ